MMGGSGKDRSLTAVIAQLTTSPADRNVIERELGAGGMAAVYLACDVRHDRKVSAARTLVWPVCLTAVLTAAAAAQAPPLDSRLALIRDRYGIIQRSRLDSSSFAYTTPGGSGAVTTAREGGQLRRIAVRFDGDGASGLWEYYYWNDSLIFSFSWWERYPPTGPEARSESRWYVVDGAVAQWILTEESGVRRTLRPGTPEFRADADAMLGRAACWRRFAEAGRPGEAEC